VRPYIVCAGIPYGNGEDAFLGLFKAAWQTRNSLRYIGDGDNCIPLVHARDVARTVRNLVDAPVSLDYHLCVDRGELTQRELIQAVADEFGVPHEIRSVSVAEAVLAELADILTLDLRMVPSDVMNVPWVEPVEAEADAEAEGNDGTGSNSASLRHDDAGFVRAASGGYDSEGGVPFAPQEPLPFRWWCEEGLAANIGKVAAEFCTWRRLQPVRVVICGPPGCGAEQVGKVVAARYNIQNWDLEAHVAELKAGETPLGQSLKESADQITAALGNPKSQGPYLMSSALTMQVIDAALDNKPSRFRGYVVSGFPQTVEEATEYFLEDAPLPPEKEEQEEAPASPEPPKKILKAPVAPDIIVVMSNSDEACLAGSGLAENEFNKRMDRWKSENNEESPALVTLFREKFQKEPLCINLEEVSVEVAAQQVAAHLESTRAIYNFMLPPKDSADTAEDAPAEEAETAKDAEALRREAEERRKQKEHDERVEIIKKDELQRLEKHSEPLRQYLMSLVVPTLTSGLIEVCRDVPDDPIGYLAEYLSVYARVARARGRKARRRTLAPEES
jgi:adenylate kinase